MALVMKPNTNPILRKYWNRKHLRAKMVTLEETITREAPMKREQMMRSLWDQIDSDNSGQLTYEEIERFLEQLAENVTKKASRSARKALRNKRQLEMLATELLTKADTSGDGLISFDEFREFLVEKEKQLFRIFQEADHDGSGQLSKSEVQLTLEKAGLKVEDRDVDTFFRILDTDQSGTLNFYELRDAFFFQAEAPSFSSLYLAYQNVYDPTISIDGVVTVTPPTRPSSAGDYTRFYIEGGVSGAISRTLTAPLDRLRTLYQTSLRNTSRQGISGNLINIAKVAPEIAVTYSSFSFLKALFSRLENREDPSPLAMLVAGGISGTLSMASVYPLETLRTRIMIMETGNTTRSSIHNVSAGEYLKTLTRDGKSVKRVAATATVHVKESGNLLYEVAREMFDTGGLKAFYRGILPASLSIFPFMATNLYAFETVKDYFASNGATQPGKRSTDVRPTTPQILAAGTISSSLASLLTYPLNLIRIRMQAQGTSGHQLAYRNSFDCLKQTFRDGGFGTQSAGINAPKGESVGKLKCDNGWKSREGVEASLMCSNCTRFGKECTYGKPTKKRGRRGGVERSTDGGNLEISTSPMSPISVTEVINTSGCEVPFLDGLEVLSSAISNLEDQTTTAAIMGDLLVASQEASLFEGLPVAPPPGFVRHLLDEYFAYAQAAGAFVRHPFNFPRHLTIALCLASLRHSRHPYIVTPPVSRSLLLSILEAQFREYVQGWTFGESTVDVTAVQAMCLVARAGIVEGYWVGARVVGMAIQHSMELNLHTSVKSDEDLPTWTEVNNLDKLFASPSRPPLLTHPVVTSPASTPFDRITQELL
ncbi:hypothetical protein HDU93_002515 [Gonapodya sp. JEL0774]|nr:hypothetical protein HDU93_002515 [Gonapodya sp. JEL0774]